MSKGLVKALKEQEAQPAEPEDVEEFYYSVLIRAGGVAVREVRVAKEEPEKLAKGIEQCRRVGTLFVWGDGAATDAKEIVDVRLCNDREIEEYDAFFGEPEPEDGEVEVTATGEVAPAAPSVAPAAAPAAAEEPKPQPAAS